MSLKSTLIAMRATIETPDKYFIGSLDAKLPRGTFVTHRNKKAVRFSLIGAWRKAEGNLEVLSALCSIHDRGKKMCMADFAKLEHYEIISLLDQAIANEGDGE